MVHCVQIDSLIKRETTRTMKTVLRLIRIYPTGLQVFVPEFKLDFQCSFDIKDIRDISIH